MRDQAPRIETEQIAHQIREALILDDSMEPAEAHRLVLDSLREAEHRGAKRMKEQIAIKFLVLPEGIGIANYIRTLPLDAPEEKPT